MTAAGTGCRIRPVRLSDAGAIADLVNPIIADGGLTAMNGPMTVPDQEGFIRALPARSVYLAAMDDAADILLGIQDCLPDQDEPTLCDVSTFVSLKAPRRGTGTALFTEMRRLLQPLDFRTVRALIRVDNTGARAFYRALGFVEADTAGSTVTALYDLA